MAKDKGKPAGEKTDARSRIFRDPENLPSIGEVLREFQRIRRRPLRVSTNLMDVTVDNKSVGDDVHIRMTVAGKVLGLGGKASDWCTFCDAPKDNCTKCDALDCIGCDAEDPHASQGETVSNPAPLTQEVIVSAKRQ